jgi:hypothetical protein
MTTEHLRLDRSHTNTGFSSWRLGASAVRQRRDIELPRPAFELRSDATDFLHTRSSVLHNYLATSQGRIFAFLEADGAADDGLLLSEIVHYYDTQQCRLQPLATLAPGADHPGRSGEPSLEPSIAVVTPAAQQGNYQALVTSGDGDLRLLEVPDAGAAALSAPVFPLRPAAPAPAGARPFVLEQAFRTGGGQLCCVAWAVRSGEAGRPACAELFALLLACEPSAGGGGGGSGGAPPQLALRGCSLLRRCALPPYAVLADPASGRVLLAVDPTTVEEEEVDVEVVECRPPGQQGGGGMPTDDGGARPAAAGSARVACRVPGLAAGAGCWACRAALPLALSAPAPAHAPPRPHPPPPQTTLTRAPWRRRRRGWRSSLRRSRRPGRCPTSSARPAWPSRLQRTARLPAAPAADAAQAPWPQPPRHHRHRHHLPPAPPLTPRPQVGRYLQRVRARRPGRHGLGALLRAAAAAAAGGGAARSKRSSRNSSQRRRRRRRRRAGGGAAAGAVLRRAPGAGRRGARPGQRVPGPHRRRGLRGGAAGAGAGGPGGAPRRVGAGARLHRRR